MGKVTRKKMARGVELTVDQVFDPISAMAAELTAGTIEGDQLEARYATFRMNFNIPWMGSKYFYDNRTSGVTGVLVSGGTAYTPGAATRVATTGGSGSGLTVDIFVDAGGIITTAVIRDTGSGYLDGETVTIQTGGANATFKLSVVPDVYDGPMYIPFCLPPLQDKLRVSSGLDLSMEAGTPFPVLDEVSFSLDQSDEGAMVLDHWYGRDQYKYTPAARWMPNPYGGKKTYTRTEAYKFTLSIYEKEQFFFNDSQQETEQFGPGGEAVSLTIPSSAFITRTRRFNPIVVGDIGRQFNPLKTYCMAIFAPELHDQNINREHCAAVNVWVSLKFRMPLTARDTASAGSPGDVQNLPLHYGVTPGPAITPVVPAAGDTIVADGQDGGLEVGISTNLQLIDQQFSDKLRGGYNEFAQTYPTQDLLDDAAYEVIAVPLGGGFAHNRMSVRDDYPLAPYVNGARFTTAGLPNVFAGDPYIDRRIIPIDGDMTIHHVIAAINWTSDKIQTSYDPSAPGPLITGDITYDPVTMPGTATESAKYSIGVGMLCGPRSDGFGYEQVAYSDFTPDPATMTTALPNGIIDLIKLGLPACEGMPAEWALLSVPIVHQTAAAAPANGNGYWGSESTPPVGVSPLVWQKGHQGTPFFVGEGNTYTRERTPVGLASLAGGTRVPFSGTLGANTPSNARGAEQFLEVRLSVDPTALTHGYLAGAWGSGLVETGSYMPTDMLIGYGGCWVYIIGKKHLK